MQMGDLRGLAGFLISGDLNRATGLDRGRVQPLGVILNLGITGYGRKAPMKSISTLATAMALSIAIFGSNPTSAASPVAGLVGSAASSVPDCPKVQWRLARHDDGNVTGIMFYSDLSGISQVTGKVDQSGKFHLVTASAMGKGPVGVVDGQRSPDGKLVADMKGEGCANIHVVMIPVTDLNVDYGGGN